MSSMAMALWSAVGATSACSPFNPTCSPPSAAAATPYIDVVNFRSSIAPRATRTTTTIKARLKKGPFLSASSSRSSSSVVAAADPVYRNKNSSILLMAMSTTRPVNVTGPATGARIIGSFGKMISRELVSRPNNFCNVSPLRSSSSTTTTSITEEQGEGEMKNRIGSLVKVKVPLKVYHVPRLPEVDLTGMEGHLKQYVGLWKGKRISANLPYKVGFVVDIQGRGPVKFFAHLKEDEFEFLD